MRLRANHLLFVLFVLLFTITSCDNVEEPDCGKISYCDCTTPGSNNTFEIVTFNMREFPLNGGETIIYASELLMQMDADVVAVQEISTSYELDKLAESMPGWEALFSPVSSWTMSLGYLYKTSEVKLNEEKTEALFPDDSYAFPRPPLKVNFTHLPSGTSVYIINNHFKCCGGDDNVARRRSAAEKLKDYIDTNLPDEKVIVLGDLNDRIDGVGEDNNVFWSFIDDEQNYKFADMGIATGSGAYWSYPAYPSHIDHLLITNECFADVDTVFTTRPDMCVADFRAIVSDHRPVELVFSY